MSGSQNLSGVVFALSLFILALSCSSESSEEDNSIIGKWRQIERAYSIGGPLIIEDVNDGDVYQIKSDGSFVYDNGSESSGTWKIEDEVLTFDFDGEVGDRIVNFSYEVEGDMLTISPAFLVCIEGCYDRYQRE